MAKKRLLLLVILSLLFTMASCGWDYAYQLDESKHNVIEEGGITHTSLMKASIM